MTAQNSYQIFHDPAIHGTLASLIDPRSVSPKLLREGLPNLNYGVGVKLSTIGQNDRLEIAEAGADALASDAGTANVYGLSMRKLDRENKPQFLGGELEIEAGEIFDVLRDGVMWYKVEDGDTVTQTSRVFIDAATGLLYGDEVASAAVGDLLVVDNMSWETTGAAGTLVKVRIGIKHTPSREAAPL